MAKKSVKKEKKPKVFYGYSEDLMTLKQLMESGVEDGDVFEEFQFLGQKKVKLGNVVLE